MIGWLSNIGAHTRRISRIALGFVGGMLCLILLASTASAAYKPPPTSPPRPGSLGWIPIVEGVVMVLTVALVIGVGLWYDARQRRAARQWIEEPILDTAIEDVEEPPLRIAFRCVACRKMFKARANLAGMKVRCPLCAKIMLVPQSAAPVNVT
jgi:DNA-directed RNA polymerase subunit RPC12/RpoP